MRAAVGRAAVAAAGARQSLPSGARQSAPAGSASLPRRAGDSGLEALRVAGLSVGTAAAFGALAAVFSVFGTQRYGSGLFIGAPFLLGVVSGFCSIAACATPAALPWPSPR